MTHPQADLIRRAAAAMLPARRGTHYDPDETNAFTAVANLLDAGWIVSPPSPRAVPAAMTAAPMTARKLANDLLALPDDQLDLPVILDGCGGCAHPCTGAGPSDDPRDEPAIWLTHEYS